MQPVHTICLESAAVAEFPSLFCFGPAGLARAGIGRVRILGAFAHEFVLMSVRMAVCVVAVASTCLANAIVPHGGR